MERACFLGRKIDTFCRTVDFICLLDHRDHLLFDYALFGRVLIEFRVSLVCRFCTRLFRKHGGVYHRLDYWFCWISIAMADLTAVGLYTQYWLPSVPQWVPGLIALIILLIMNLATVKLFGEMEFWFALVKVIAILALIVIGLFMIFTGFTTMQV